MLMKSFVPAALLWLLATRAAFAQDPTGTIEGVVTDKTSSAIAGAHVVAVNTATSFTRSATAGPDGFFRLVLIPVGTYRVTIEAPQFATVVQESVQVTLSQAVRVNVQLELSSLKETVTVSGGVQLVDTSTNALGPRRQRPRAGRPAAQRPQLHAAGSAADRCRPSHVRSGHRGRLASSGAGVCGQRHEA